MLRFSNYPKCPKCADFYWYNPTEKTIGTLGCKGRTCPVCGEYWAKKWRKALAYKIDRDLELGKNPPRRALLLTTAYNVGYKELWLALKIFWRYMRKEFGKALQYYGVVEYNQTHTQPHLHFILSDDKFMHWKKIKVFWLKSQKQAGFRFPAWKITIEEIRHNIADYFLKYLTKAAGGKDEIPRADNWKGRYVRYSRNFFGCGLDTILDYLKLKAIIDGRRKGKTYALQSYSQPLLDLLQGANYDTFIIGQLVNRAFVPHSDNIHGALSRYIVFTDLEVLEAGGLHKFSLLDKGV